MTTAATSPGTEELYWESRVADSLGVARKLVVQLRKEHLTDGAHYRREKNNVVLTPAGLALLKQHLAPAPLATPEAEQTATKPGPPPRRMMVVVRVAVNHRLLWCYVKSDAKRAQVLVRVRDNKDFMPGMELEAIDAGFNQWQYAGRMPRRKGRW